MGTRHADAREAEHRRRPTAASVCVTRHEGFEFIVIEVFRLTMMKQEFRDILESAEQKAIDALNGKAFNLRRAQWRHAWRRETKSAVDEQPQSSEEKAFWRLEKTLSKKGMSCWYSQRYRLKNPNKVKQSRKKWESSETARNSYARRQDRYWTKYWAERGKIHYGKYSGCDTAHTHEHHAHNVADGHIETKE